ncbi:MAG: hypothetical protein M3N43_10720, partial [Actinomycetota bacterium]|nr:hypothetical protein [Actinomycetota bacterium]
VFHLRSVMGFLALPMLLTLSGCEAGDLLASRDLIEVEAGFRTDASSYHQAAGTGRVVASIAITLENRFGTSLVPVPCTEEAPEWTLERQEGERWEPVATGACLLASWAMITVSPGASYHGVVRLASAVEPGTYRLVLGLLEVTGDATRPVVDGRARSNTFQLTD